MAKQIAQGAALGLNYEIFERAGEVSHSETRSETEVQGNISGGGGYSSSGTGFQSPVSGQVTSKTTRFQNIFLTDRDGNEHTVELKNFLVPCKSGHNISLFLITSGGRDKGSYFSAYNHDTRQSYNHFKALRSELFPVRIFTILLVVSFLILFFGTIGESDSTFLGTVFYSVFVTAVIAIPAWIAGAGVALYRSMAVRKDLNFKNYLQQAGIG